jgi:nitrite reductase/ring-hydroxylating ferredoxin subunit
MSVRKTLCRIDEIPDGGAIAVELSVEDQADVAAVEGPLILLRQNVRVDAYRNICPHAGRRLDWAPGRFLIEEGFLICPAHGAMFTLGSGECVAGPCRGSSLTRIPVEVVEGEVCLPEGA